MTSICISAVLLLAAAYAQENEIIDPSDQFRTDRQTLFQIDNDLFQDQAKAKVDIRTSRAAVFYNGYSSSTKQPDRLTAADIRTDRQFILNSEYGSSDSHRARMIARDLRTDRKSILDSVSGYSEHSQAEAYPADKIRTDRQALFDSSYGLKEETNDKLSFDQIRTNRELALDSVFAKINDESLTEDDQILPEDEQSILESIYQEQSENFAEEGLRHDRQADYYSHGHRGRFIRPGQGEHMQDGGFGLNRNVFDSGDGRHHMRPILIGHSHHHHRAGYRPPY